MLQGQMTMFAIIGALLVILVGTVVMLDNDTSVQIDQVHQETPADEVRSYITSCVSQMLDVGTYFVSVQGGYDSIEGEYEVADFTRIPYYIGARGTLTMPSLSAVETHLEEFLARNVPVCLDEFRPYQDRGMRVTHGDLSIDVSIGDTLVNAILDNSFSVTTTDGVYDIPGIVATVAIPLGNAHALADEVIKEVTVSYPDFPLSAALDVAEQYNSNYTQLYPRVGSLIHVFTFPVAGNNNLVYSFGTKHPVQIVVDDELFIFPVPDLVTSGEVLEYTVRASESGVSFSDDSSLIDIHPTSGLLYMDPTYVENQYHLLTVRARSQNQVAEQDVLVLINHSTYYPAFADVPVLNANVGVEFVHTLSLVEQTDRTVLFSDTSDEFDIHPLTGEIRFTPVTPGIISTQIAAVVEGKTTHTSVVIVVE